MLARDLGSITSGRHAATTVKQRSTAQNAAPADPLGEHAADASSDQLPDQRRSDVAAQGDLSDRQGKRCRRSGPCTPA